MTGKTSGNVNLSAAKIAKKDEFYTQLTDIEKEMRYYRKHFKERFLDRFCCSVRVWKMLKSPRF